MASVSATVANNQLGQVLEAALTERVTITKNGGKAAVLLSWQFSLRAGPAQTTGGE